MDGEELVSEGKKVIYYGHSTMEDFMNSFRGSNLVAPLFKKWLQVCYRQGDIICNPNRIFKKTSTWLQLK